MARSIKHRLTTMSLPWKFFLSFLLFAFVLSLFADDASLEAETKSSTSLSEENFPRITGSSDGILEGIVRDFFNQNENEAWWSRIQEVHEGVIGDETAKMVYIKTNYSLADVDDVEQGTLLCNALVSFLPRDGLAVRVDGILVKGREKLDGTLETAEVSDPITTFGSSWNPGANPDWCVARTLFVSVRDGLKARGWKQQYGYGELSAEEKRKMYEGAFMQEGAVYIVNK